MRSQYEEEQAGSIPVWESLYPVPSLLMAAEADTPQHIAAGQKSIAKETYLYILADPGEARGCSTNSLFLIN